MAEGNFNEQLQAEIKELEGRLEAKKQQLGAESRPEKEIFKEVLRERFTESAQPVQHTQNSVSVPAPVVPAPKKDDSAQAVKREAEVEQLLRTAFEKNPQEAIEEAGRLGGEYLVDELHDRLADQYYQKLLEFRKVREL